MKEKLEILILPIPCGVFDGHTPVSQSSTDISGLIDSLHTTCSELKEEFKNVQIDIHSNEEEAQSFYSVVTLSGPSSQLFQIKDRLYAQHPKLDSSIIKANTFDLFQTNHQLKPEVKEKFTQIMQSTNTEILMRLTYSDYPILICSDSVGEVFIEIRGSSENVQRANLKCLVYLDELAGLFIETVQMEPKLIPVINGRKSENIERIMEETLTSIYLPCLLTSQPTGHDEMNKKIIITGRTKDSVQKAVDGISKISKPKTGPVQQTLIVGSSKMTFLLRNYFSEIRDIMFENACYIQITQNQDFLIIADRDALALAAVKKLVDLMTKIVMLQIHLAPSWHLPKDPFIQKLTLACKKSKAEISLLDHQILILGLPESVLEAGKIFREMEELQPLVKDIHFKIDLSTEYHSFITGKKNGKINKIIKSANVNIQFLEQHAHYLVMDLSSHTYAKAVDGFIQLEDELPAEFEFYVEDHHHKRIIGVGGKNIQGIMKQYGVYVKFLSNDEFAPYGGVNNVDKNVIARTPYKNANNLKNLYYAIMELVNTKEKEAITLTLDVPRRYHHLISGQYGNKKKQLEDKNHVKIQIPSVQSGNEKITVTGLEKEVQNTLELLREMIPEKYYYRLAEGASLSSLTASPEYKALVEQFNRDFKIELGTENGMITLLGTQSTAKFMSNAVSLLVALLKQKNIPVIENEEDDEHPELTAMLKSENEQQQQQQNDILFTHSFNSFALNKKPKFSDSAPNLRNLSLHDSPLKIMTGSLTTTTTEPEKKEPEFPMKRSHWSHHYITRYHQQMELPSPTVDVRFLFSASTPNYSQMKGAPHDFREGKNNVPNQSPNDVDKRPSRQEHHDDRPQFPPGLNVQPEEENTDLIKSIVKNVLPEDNQNHNKLNMLLTSLDMSKYLKTFIDNEVDFEMFLTLTEEDFKELGLSMGARKKLLVAIQEIKQRRSLEYVQRAHLSVHDQPQSPLSPSVNTWSTNLSQSQVPSSGQGWSKMQMYQQNNNLNGSSNNFNKSFPPMMTSPVGQLSPTKNSPKSPASAFPLKLDTSHEGLLPPSPTRSESRLQSILSPLSDSFNKESKAPGSKRQTPLTEKSSFFSHKL